MWNNKMSRQFYSVLGAFMNIVNQPNSSINPAKISNNRINNVGDAFEGYVKDAIAGLLGRESIENSVRDRVYSEVFSWLGNGSNPPDCIIKNGDAIEIKKVESLSADIALNSSHPRNKLYIDDTRVASGAKVAEEWQVKDIVYAIGTPDKNAELKRMWLIYGDCYCASRQVYTKLFSTIEKGVNSIPDTDFQKTNELGKVKKVDPLGITTLRIRGMWHIANPSRLYGYFIEPTKTKQFYLLMRESKYQSFSEEERSEIEGIKKLGYSSDAIEIRDPDNPAKLIRARLIKYEI